MSTQSTPKKGSKFKTALLFILPLAAGAFALWYINKPKGRKGAEKAKDATSGTEAANTVRAADSSAFPLKYGSKGEMVSQLQNALIAAYGSAILPKYGADGDWGSETSVALKNKLNVSQIMSQVDYDALLKKIQSAAGLIANVNRADDIVSKWKSSSSLMLMAIRSTIAFGVSQDYSGALTLTNKNITLSAGRKLSRQDYVLQASTKNGFIIFTITTGSLAGLYKVLAEDVSLG